MCDTIEECLALPGAASCLPTGFVKHFRAIDQVIGKIGAELRPLKLNCAETILKALPIIIQDLVLRGDSEDLTSVRFMPFDDSSKAPKKGDLPPAAVALVESIASKDPVIDAAALSLCSGEPGMYAQLNGVILLYNLRCHFCRVLLQLWAINAQLVNDSVYPAQLVDAFGACKLAFATAASAFGSTEWWEKDPPAMLARFSIWIGSAKTNFAFATTFWQAMQTSVSDIGNNILTQKVASVREFMPVDAHATRAP